MIRIEGIPVVAARLAEAEKSKSTMESGTHRTQKQGDFADEMAT